MLKEKNFNEMTSVTLAMLGYLKNKKQYIESPLYQKLHAVMMDYVRSRTYDECIGEQHPSDMASLTSFIIDMFGFMIADVSNINQSDVKTRIKFMVGVSDTVLDGIFDMLQTCLARACPPGFDADEYMEIVNREIATILHKNQLAAAKIKPQPKPALSPEEIEEILNKAGSMDCGSA